MDFDLTGRDASADGMICGGRARLLLDYLAPDAANAAFFKDWHQAAGGGQEFFCLTRLEETAEGVSVTGRSLLFPDGRVLGSALPGIERHQADLRAVSATAVLEIEDARLVVERIRPLKTLYCFGAGHVAVPTAHIAALAGFRVVVADDRADYATAERFPEAAEVRLIDDFERALDGLDIDADSYIIILTRSHQYDRAVLGQAVKTGAGYVGMISSRRKREAIYKALMEAGVTPPELERVHSPIGIEIGGETPEEIAVSIVAELISHRAGQP
jgi:xanthine dehydrogenase accessory factor